MIGIILKENCMTEVNIVDSSSLNNRIVVFKPSIGETEYEVIIDENSETLWATELQIAQLFDRDRTVINKHIKNIFSEGELNEGPTCAKIALVRKEGGREISREVQHNNLDEIISVGYRVKSPLATEFRKWATNKLKDYLLKGYAINNRLLENKTERIKELAHLYLSGFLNKIILVTQKTEREKLIIIL
jgi:hypothetical protein